VIPDLRKSYSEDINISVIIPTRDRAESLKRALNSVSDQTMPLSDFEVIVVDNGSKDNTQGVCSKVGSLFPNFRVLFAPQPGLHVGRHVGLLHSKGGIVVFIDDDIEATPMWLEAIRNAFTDEGIALVGGRIIPKWEIEPPDWIKRRWQPNRRGERVMGQLSLIDLGNQARGISPLLVFGCNYAIRKQVLVEARGFHPDGMPQHLILYRGDGETHVSKWLLSHGYLAWYDPDASVFHHISAARMTVGYFQRRMYNQGISDSYTRIRFVAKPKETGLRLYRNEETWTRQVRTVLKRLKKKCYHVLSNLIKQLRKEKCEGDSVEELLRVSYRDGFEFHQKAVSLDPTLREWVLRDTYLDDQEPLT
jgi:glycosyltransferase involved in cell wall biosynthesis